jgi:hypothetical protein
LVGNDKWLVAGVDLNHRPLGYEGNSTSDGIQNRTTKCNEIREEAPADLIPLCMVLLPVHGQKADNESSTPEEFSEKDLSPAKILPTARDAALKHCNGTRTWRNIPCQRATVRVIARRSLFRVPSYMSSRFKSAGVVDFDFRTTSGGWTATTGRQCFSPTRVKALWDLNTLIFRSR